METFLQKCFDLSRTEFSIRDFLNQFCSSSLGRALLHNHIFHLKFFQQPAPLVFAKEVVSQSSVFELQLCKTFW